VDDPETKTSLNSQKVQVAVLKFCHLPFSSHRSTVQMMMAVLDSQGAKRRRRRQLKRRVYQNKVREGSYIFILVSHKQGPDFVWHLDGYDKLKPYGFAIHGCIDG